METKHINYNFERSLERIDEILDSANNNYKEKGTDVPSRDKLTYTNGFYVDVSAIFVDIRNSSSLPNTHTRPTLAKIYRSFISEVVAIMNGNNTCHEINIIGDCVSGVFETPTQEDKHELIGTAAEINGIIHVLNCKLSKKNIQNIRIGIGIDYGRALMIKAGYKGSEISEIVWMGDVVNNASNLSKEGGKTIFYPTIIISNDIYNKISLDYKQHFKYHRNNTYGSTVITKESREWLDKNHIN